VDLPNCDDRFFLKEQLLEQVVRFRNIKTFDERYEDEIVCDHGCLFEFYSCVITCYIEEDYNSIIHLYGTKIKISLVSLRRI